MTTALGYALVLSIGTGTALAALHQPPVARRMTTALGYALVLRTGTGFALSFSSLNIQGAGGRCRPRAGPRLRPGQHLVPGGEAIVLAVVSAV